MLTVLCGGVGAAKFLTGLVAIEEPTAITAVVNVADDDVIHGLYVSPDVDTIIYTLARMHNEATGWGIADESWRVMDELESLGGSTWFRLGDRDLATHIYRSDRLHEAAPLSVITAELCAARGVQVKVLPATDDPVSTQVTTREGERLSFQEYFVQRRHDVDVQRVDFEGAGNAEPAPGVLEAIGAATRLIFAPSNPLVSIDPILMVPGVYDAVVARRADAVAISPIVAGAALKGPADRLMGDLGLEVSALGVARHFAEMVATFVVDVLDEALVPEIEALGMRCVVTDTVMKDPATAAGLATVVRDG